jgi:hypothetical protein
MGVFDIVMEKPAEVSRGDGCVWHSHGKTLLKSVEEVRAWHSHGKTCCSQLKRCVLDIVMERLDWLQQVFPWLYQTHPSHRLISAGFSMTIKHTHRLVWLQQVVPWLCQAHTSSTDFSRLFHDYIKHTHPFDWPQHVFPWLYQTHSPLRLNSAGFFMTISNKLTASTDFSRFFHDYIKHNHRLDRLQQLVPWLYQTHPSLRLTSAGFSMTISNVCLI